MEPFALVYLGMFMRSWNSNGVRFEVVPPVSLKVRQYLARQNFWERFNFDANTVDEERVHGFTTSTSLNDIIDVENTAYIAEDATDKFLDLLFRSRVRIDAETIAEMVSELVDNFAQHSERNMAAFIAQYFPRLKRIDVVIGDCGIGIRESLSQTETYAHLAKESHHRVIRKAFDRLVTRKSEGGLGLTDVADGIRRLDGLLTLTSGDGYIQIGRDFEEYGSMSYDMSGVQIELSIPERS